MTNRDVILYNNEAIIPSDCNLIDKRTKEDKVKHPAHYNQSRFETIDVIEEWKLGFHLGNVVKYISRAEFKGETLEDLKKARWYLDKYIKMKQQDYDEWREEQLTEIHKHGE